MRHPNLIVGRRLAPHLSHDSIVINGNIHTSIQTPATRPPDRLPEHHQAHSSSRLHWRRRQMGLVHVFQ